MSRGNTKSILDLMNQRASFKRNWISDAKHRLHAAVSGKNLHLVPKAGSGS